jgi:hypothetical protein
MKSIIAIACLVLPLVSTLPAQAAQDQMTAAQAAASSSAQEEPGRDEIEALRREFSENCAQDPRHCASRKAALDEKLHGGWRDQEGEGHAAQ